MIQVTMSFASVAEMIATLGPKAVVLTAGDAAADLAGTPRPDNPTPAAGKPAPAPKAPKPAAAAPAPAKAPAAPAAPAAIEYPVLQKAVFELAAKNKQAVMDVLAGLGVASAKELPAERYAEALAAVQAKTAELNAAVEVA